MASSLFTSAEPTSTHQYSSLSPQKDAPVLASPATTARTLVEMLTQYVPVQELVLDHLEIRDVLALTKTTKSFRDFYHIVERTQLNIDKELGHFFTSPIDFRSL
jgi:hypothetical protein